MRLGRMAQEGMKMAKGRRPRRQGRNSVSLQETGLRLAFLGLAFLIGPKLFGASPMMRVVSAGLSLPGWLLLGAGALMLGIVFVKKQGNPSPQSAMPGVRPDKPWALTEAEQQELSESLARRSPIRAAKAVSARFGRESDGTPDINFGRKADDRTATPPPKSTEWSPAVFAAIEWRRFEAVCETLFGQAGFETRSQTHGAKGGAAFWGCSNYPRCKTTFKMTAPI